jgi:hypothetical protein
MRIGRTALIPIILALGIAGSVLAGSEVSAAVVHAPGVHAHPAAPSSALRAMKYHD